jgi:enoyl-CoA hydratase
MPTYSTLLVTTEDAVATLTLNRPDKLNALNAELLKELYAAVHALEADATVRAVVVTGAGEKAFAAGADIAAMSEMSTTQAKTFADLGHAIGAAMEASRVPYVAAVNGFALGGGCELALACDFIYAADKAKFGQPEVNLGVIPGFGGTQRLARRVGIGRARELCMTGDIIGAEEALRIGLVNRVTSREELVGAAREAAKKIAGKGPLAVAQCKRVMLRGADLPLTTAHELEAQAFSALFGSQDQREGMKAFVEKRPARFEGR